MFLKLIEECVEAKNPMTAMIMLAGNNSLAGASYGNNKTYTVTGSIVRIPNPHFSSSCDLVFDIVCDHAIHLIVEGQRFEIDDKTVIPILLLRNQQVVYIVDVPDPCTKTVKFSCQEVMLNTRHRGIVREAMTPFSVK